MWRVPRFVDWECESQGDLEPDDIAECLRYAALAVQERKLPAGGGVGRHLAQAIKTWHCALV